MSMTFGQRTSFFFARDVAYPRSGHTPPPGSAAIPDDDVVGDVLSVLAAVIFAPFLASLAVVWLVGNLVSRLLRRLHRTKPAPKYTVIETENGPYLWDGKTMRLLPRPRPVSARHTN